MERFMVEFTQTVYVEAETPEEAAEKAWEEFSQDDMYVYVNDEMVQGP